MAATTPAAIATTVSALIQVGRALDRANKSKRPSVTRSTGARRIGGSVEGKPVEDGASFVRDGARGGIRSKAKLTDVSANSPAPMSMSKSTSRVRRASTGSRGDDTDS